MPEINNRKMLISNNESILLRMILTNDIRMTTITCNALKPCVPIFLQSPQKCPLKMPLKNGEKQRRKHARYKC